MPLTVVASRPFAQVSVPPPGLFSIESRTVAVMPVVTTLPPASSIATLTGVLNCVPAVDVAGGWTRNASFVAGPIPILKGVL